MSWQATAPWTLTGHLPAATFWSQGGERKAVNSSAWTCCHHSPRNNSDLSLKTESFLWRSLQLIHKLEMFSTSRISGWSFLDFFFRKGWKELVWLCFGFLCAAASSHSPMWLGLRVEVHWFLWKKLCALEDTQDSPSIIPVFERIVRLALPEILVLISFLSFKSLPFLFLWHPLSDRVLKFGDPASPAHLSSFHLMILFPCLAEKPCFHLHPSNHLKQRFYSFFSLWCQSIYYQIVWL